jgi:hypothetical protein
MIKAEGGTTGPIQTSESVTLLPPLTPVARTMLAEGVDAPPDSPYQSRFSCFDSVEVIHQRVGALVESFH